MIKETANNWECLHLLRPLAAIKKNGVLDISAKNSSLEIYFLAGEIFEVIKDRVNPIIEVFQLLNTTGIIPSLPSVKNINSYAQAYLKVKECLSEELFQEALKVCVTNKAYNIWHFYEGAKWSFKTKLYPKEDLQPLIKCSSILLDILAIEENKTNWQKFKNALLKLNRERKEALFLSKNEKKVVDYLKERETAFLEDIERELLLTQYELQDAVLTLLDEKILTIDSNKRESSTVDIISETLNKAYNKIKQERESLKKETSESKCKSNQCGEKLEQEVADEKSAFNGLSLAVINSKMLQSSEVLKITAWIISFLLLLAPFFHL